MLTRKVSLKIQPPVYGSKITILSIDGGGIRGILPGVILAYLEAQLQVCIFRNFSNLVVPQEINIAQAMIYLLWYKWTLNISIRKTYRSNVIYLLWLVHVGAWWRGCKDCRLFWCNLRNKYWWSHNCNVSCTKRTATSSFWCQRYSSFLP